MEHQHLQCEQLTLHCFTLVSPTICPGPTVVRVASVIVELPRIEYPTVMYTPAPQQFILLNMLVQLPDFRGPPLGLSQDYSSYARPLLIAESSARGVHV